MRKARFLFLRRTYGYGGVENRLIDWLTGVDYERADVTIITHLDVFTDRFRELNIPAEVETTSLGGWFSFGNLKGWYDLLKRHRPDIAVFLQGDFFDIPWFLFGVAKMVGVKKIYLTEHLAVDDPPVKPGGYYFNVIPRLNLGWRWRLRSHGARGRLADKVLAVSDGVRQKLLRWKYPEDNVVVIKHGVDTDLFRPSAESRTKFRERYGIPPHAQVIISTARFEKQKRLERIAESFRALRGEYGRLWVVFAGDGSLVGEIRDAVGSDGRALFLGLLRKPLIAEALQGSDIYVLASDNEGFSNALIEAMSTGLICVATKVPGSVDIIEDGVNGFLADARTEDVLAMLRKVLALDESRRAGISENARKTVKRSYQKDIVMREVLQHLELPPRVGH